MTLFIILACVFGGLAIIVFVTERYSKPLTDKQQTKLSKIIPTLVFILLAAALIRNLLE